MLSQVGPPFPVLAAQSAAPETEKGGLLPRIPNHMAKEKMLNQTAADILKDLTDLVVLPKGIMDYTRPILKPRRPSATMRIRKSTQELIQQTGLLGGERT